MRGQGIEQTVRVWPSILLMLLAFVLLVSCPEAEGSDDPQPWLDASEWIGSPAVPLTIHRQTDPFLVGLAIGRAMRREPRDVSVTVVVTPASPPRMVCLEFDITEDNKFVCVKYEVKHDR